MKTVGQNRRMQIRMARQSLTTVSAKALIRMYIVYLVFNWCFYFGVLTYVHTYTGLANLGVLYKNASNSTP